MPASNAILPAAEKLPAYGGAFEVTDVKMKGDQAS